jgi:hypothetical protein
MWGDAIGDAPGVNASDVTSLDGGEIKLIDAERATPHARPARVIHTQLRVNGPLAASTVELSMVSKLDKVRECYRADPASHGTEEARVDLKFTITSEGSIGVANTREAKHIEPATIQCILDQLKAARFLTASSNTDVTYPLVFVPGGTETPGQANRVELAPTIVHPSTIVFPCSGRSAKSARDCTR